ncbi:hypothetical protein [Maricaulis salignorans]|uniref:Uncharacterized protein n=1 Tax=Maricaulis salignorans TaxID=144026 RepID=A0A1G9P110_9PROT|nr:hypothetical protein [Maricaulis salignorans]SDL92360.1 hypothetical protein SAMN04488568_10365 [Maricaulis salignorans]
MLFNDNDSSAYRRGVVLGLTLAELLLLLLFLFLLLMSSILFRREEEQLDLERRYDASEIERRAFRGAFEGQLEITLGNELAGNIGAPLTQEQLQEPLARLAAMSSENVALRTDLEAATSELAALRDGRPFSQQEASTLRQENARLERQLAMLRDELGDVSELVSAANAVDPERSAADVLNAAMSSYAGLNNDQRMLPDQLAQCHAERSNIGSQLDYIRAQCGRAGDLPPCVYRDDGAIAYSYNVVLSQDGVTAGRGDEGRFRSIPWVAALPDPRLGQPMSLNEFLGATRSHFQASQQQNPECRFFVRIYDQMGDASRQEFLDQYLGVQSHFYHHLVRGG